MSSALILNDTIVSQIAREIARNLVPVAEIRTKFMLSPEQYDELLALPMFRQRLEEELEVWNSSDPKSIVTRIGAKAATMVEESLIEVYHLIHDRAQPFDAKIKALKWASDMAGIGTNPNIKPGGGDGGVKIVINIGDKRVEFDKERALPSQVIDGEVIDLTTKVA